MSEEQSVPDEISALIEGELAVAKRSDDQVLRRTAQDFVRALCPPCEVTVNFSGGIRQRCWSVTRGDGDYQVIYLPKAGYFALCAQSGFGPLDIGVHGPALGCFGSV
jgi:hypothetical protein